MVVISSRSLLLQRLQVQRQRLHIASRQVRRPTVRVDDDPYAAIRKQRIELAACDERRDIVVPS
jgi:hypothetical protein